MGTRSLTALFRSALIQYRLGAMFLILLPLGCAGINARQKIDDKILKKAVEGKPAYLHELIKSELEEGKRNYVLNWNRIGLRSLRHGDFDLSARYLDLSIRKINEIFSDDSRSQKARSLWFAEETKAYKGDPYERAMTFFFRGVSYYMKGDLENARAMFKSGQIQDAFAEEGQHKADYALFDYLEGRITQLLDPAGNSKKLFDRVKKLRPGFPIPSRSHNLLIVAAVNSGPVKYSTSDHPDVKERVKIRIAKGKETITTLLVFYKNKIVGSFSKIEDLNFQASTRGGRVFDAIVKGKVEFKDETDKAGGKALVAGAAIVQASGGMRNSNARAAAAVVGLGVMAVGGILKAVSSLTDASVDTRTWKSLPGQFHIWSRKVKPGTLPIQVRYYKRGIGKDRTIARLMKQKKANSPQFHEILKKYEVTGHRKNISLKMIPNKKDTIVYIPSPNFSR